MKPRIAFYITARLSNVPFGVYLRLSGFSQLSITFMFICINFNLQFYLSSKTDESNPFN